MKNYLPKQSLGVKVIVSIIVISSFVTLIATGTQLYIEYKRDIDLLHGRVEQIKSGYLKSISSSLWAVDKEQLNLLLEGIQHLPDIQRVEIQVSEYPYIGVGEIPLKHMRQYSFPLNYQYDNKMTNLGELNVFISLQGIYDRLINRISIILGSQAIKTFIVSIMALLIFHYFVTRHLNTIFRAVSDMSIKDGYGEIILDRNTGNHQSKDEFDKIVNAFNKLIYSLKESYDALQKSEERFDLAMQGANDGLWDWSIDKKEIYFSDRYKEILGIDENELLGSFAEWSNRIHPDDRKETLANLGKSLRGEIDQFNHRYRLRHQNQTYRWVLSRGLVMNNNNKPVRMVGTIMDITKHKEAEDKLASALDKLESEHNKRIIAERLACVGELSANIAHEIRNPLCSIIGAVEHISDDMLSKDDRNDMCNILHDETKRLDRVLTDFLQFSRQREPEITSVDINKLLHDAVKTIKIDYDVDHIKFIENYSIDISNVLCDSDLIKQVFWNLLKNAVQSIERKGEIIISLEKQADKCLISIRDNGIGIEPKLKDTIIEPFVTHRKKGTGLGLAISSKILSSHHSELIIGSVENVGTEVKFMLQVA